MSSIQLITGRLAEKGLRQLAVELSRSLSAQVDVAVLPINVVSLAPMEWIGRHHSPTPDISKVVLPGLCRGDLGTLSSAWGVPVERGPEDYRDLPEYFRIAAHPVVLDQQNIEILAEINFAPRLERQTLIDQAQAWVKQGADRIDLGSEPGQRWSAVGDRVKELVDLGIEVSIDSFDSWEVAEAVGAGAKLVLSVNSSNRERARDWGVEVVAIPDSPSAIETLWETARYLADEKIPHRLDPILEPIGHGFGTSILRYHQTRQEFPETPMLMGIGNLTEMTEVDSAGVNFLLLALCQEWQIGSVLTTEVASWCQSCVREIDRMRRVLHYAIAEGVVPKRLDRSLVLLREGKSKLRPPIDLDELAACLTDRNIRLFAQNGLIEAMNGHFRAQDSDPFELFEQIAKHEPIDPSHAFYLGYEMAKATTALTLGKTYRQDAALDWGFLTRPETSHRAKDQERGNL